MRQRLWLLLNGILIERELVIYMPVNIGATGFILIVLVTLLLFGPSKLPQLGRAIGTTFREFREGTRELVQQADDQEDTYLDKGTDKGIDKGINKGIDKGKSSQR